MKGASEKSLEVNIVTLLMIKKPVQSYLYKIDSMIEDHYSTKHQMQDSEVLSMMELKISANVLLAYIDELLAQAEEANVKSVHLPTKEVLLITNLSKNLSSSMNLPIAGTSMSEH